MDSFKVISFLSSQFAFLCQRTAWSGYKCFVAGPGEPIVRPGALRPAASGKFGLWGCGICLPSLHMLAMKEVEQRNAGCNLLETLGPPSSVPGLGRRDLEKTGEELRNAPGFQSF